MLSPENLIFQSDVETDKIFHIASGELTVSRSLPQNGAPFSIPFVYEDGHTTGPGGQDRHAYFEAYWRIKGTGAWQQGSRIPGSALGSGVGFYATVTNDGNRGAVTAWLDMNVVQDSNPRTIEWRVIVFDSNEHTGIVDVTTTTDTDVQWSSFYDYRKIHKKGSIDMTITDSAQTKSVSHTLGYRPVVKAWFIHRFLPFPGAPSEIKNTHVSSDFFIDTIVTNTKVDFSVIPGRMGGQSASGQLEYRIYRND